MEYALAINASAFDRLYVIAEGMNGSIASYGNSIELRQNVTRSTFADVLALARLAANDDDLVVIANADIVVPARSVASLSIEVQRRDAFALSRYEVERNGATRITTGGKHSQDVWATRGVPDLDAKLVSFFFGVPGCDNAYAYALYAAGYDVQNPSLSIKTIHLHASGKRTATNTRPHRVAAPYLYVEPHKLGEVPEIKVEQQFATSI